MSIAFSTNQSLIHTNVKTLEEGLELLSRLQADQYTRGYKPAFQSTIGAHFRHLLEHYRCLLQQLPAGTICYDQRERDAELEIDIEYARRTIQAICADLNNLAEDVFGMQYRLIDQQVAEPVETTLERELLFLQSHSVHHYAIIAAMTRAFGVEPDKEFGVAIATRSYQATLAFAENAKSV